MRGPLVDMTCRAHIFWLVGLGGLSFRAPRVCGGVTGPESLQLRKNEYLQEFLSALSEVLNPGPSPDNQTRHCTSQQLHLNRYIIPRAVQPRPGSP